MPAVRARRAVVLGLIHKVCGSAGIRAAPIMCGFRLGGGRQYMTIQHHPDNQLDSYHKEEPGKPRSAEHC
jgi:hypothetical protein